VRVVDVGIHSLGFTGGTATVTVALSNPNRSALEVEGFIYKLEVESGGDDGGWVVVADGITDLEVRVPSRDSVTVELPVPFEYSGVGAALRSIFERGEVGYRASGEVRVRGPVGGIRIPYRKQGVLGS
jgi:LEA14-like dessication related protein